MSRISSAIRARAVAVLEELADKRAILEFVPIIGTLV
jgi:hypothetical protein